LEFLLDICLFVQVSSSRLHSFSFFCGQHEVKVKG